MLTKRVLVALALAAIGIPAILVGSYFYSGLITIILGIAAWELVKIFRAAGLNAAEPLLIGGVVILLVARVYFPEWETPGMTILMLTAMTWHLIDFERGRTQAASDFAVTVMGMVYLGWVGAYLIILRNIDNGLWWLLLTLPAVWLADTGAYFIGSRFGRHKLSQRLSPKKSWEGYLAGIVFSILGTSGLAVLWHSIGAPDLGWWKGAILGAVISSLTLLGDLGESMFKRQAGLKDSSNILPGHGGVLDRIDSWLWAGALGYLLVVWFFI